MLSQLVLVRISVLCCACWIIWDIFLVPLDCCFDLDVVAAPRITQHPGSRLEAREAQPLLLDCVTQGNPRPEVQWLLPDAGDQNTSFLGRARL